MENGFSAAADRVCTACNREFRVPILAFSLAIGISPSIQGRYNLWNINPVLLLPTAAQRLIELDQSNEFVRLGLRQPELSGKGIRLIGQHLQVIGGSGLETHLREPCRILRRFEQVLLLNSELSILAIRNQAVRDVPKRAFNRLFVSQKHLVVLRLG